MKVGHLSDDDIPLRVELVSERYQVRVMFLLR
jgi:hypothetical protein